MRLILTILLLKSVAFGQTNRYVSNSGSDAFLGTNSNPYATIYKALSVAVPGDSILLNGGSTFLGNYIISTSGLNFSSYGSGTKPIVSSLQSKTGFTNILGNIWTATADSAVTGLNLVYLNGSIAHKGRFPNVGWSTFTGGVDSTISTSLTGNHTGYSLAVRTVPWIIDLTTIKSQSGGTLSFSPKLTYPTIYGGNGYFLQNQPSLVDTVGEYYYNDTTKLLTVYSIGTPSVQIATRDTLIRLNHIASASFSNIQFSGANRLLMFADTSNHVSVINCKFDGSGGNGFAGHTIASKFDKDTLQNINNNGIDIKNNYILDCDSNRITNTSFKKIGLIEGMGYNGEQQYEGMIKWGSFSAVKYNSFDSIGYIGMDFTGNFDSVFYNHFSNFCMIKSDGAGIYSHTDGSPIPGFKDSGTIIRGNLFENGIGAPKGTTNGILANAAAGVYLDEGASFVLVDSNSIYNSFQAGILFHNVNNNIATNNNIYSGPNSYGFVLSGATSLTYHNTFKHNQVFAEAGQYVSYRNFADFDESIDSNYLSRWTTEGQFMYNQGTIQTLSVWAGATNWDRHSSPTPVNVTYDPVLYYSNPSKSPLTIINGFTYTDFTGNSANSFTLPPYHSMILFKALNQVVPPVPPGKTTSNPLSIKIAQK